MLNLKELQKSFGEKQVLCGASLRVETGEIAALCGMSGCGKTTLLRIAAGLEAADFGTVERSGKVAVAFQEPRLFPGLCAVENVTCVMHGKKAENEAIAREILAGLDLSGSEHLLPRELSGGMAARVSLARAIAYDADIYLLDEPFGRLDGAVKADVMAYMKAFLREKTTLFITHDNAETRFADRVYQMESGRITLHT